jgi:hypothetical protein
MAVGDALARFVPSATAGLLSMLIRVLSVPQELETRAPWTKRRSPNNTRIHCDTIKQVRMPMRPAMAMYCQHVPTTVLHSQQPSCLMPVAVL